LSEFNPHPAGSAGCRAAAVGGGRCAFQGRSAAERYSAFRRAA